MAKGRHVRLTIRDLNALNGVRFRVMKPDHGNGKQPANDLILGAMHYPQQLKPDGTFDPTGLVSLQAARDRWETAARSHDDQLAADARSLLTLLQAPEPPQVPDGQQ